MSAQLEAPPKAAGGVSRLRQQFRDTKAELIEQFRASRATVPAVARLIKSLTRHVDATLADLWLHALMPPGATLVGVGGYGRGELFPYSDVDVLVLVHPKNLSDDTLYAIDQFVMRGGRALIFVDPQAEALAGADPTGLGIGAGASSSSCSRLSPQYQAPSSL